MRPLPLLGLAFLALTAFGCGNPAGPAPGPRVNTDSDSPSDGSARTGCGKAIVIEGMRVEIESPRVGPVALRDLGRPAQSQERHFIFTLRISTSKPDRKFDYTTWADGRPVLKDDLGNIYRQVTWGFGAEPEGRTKSATVYADKPVRDV